MRHLRERDGRFYFQPSAVMRKAGFRPAPLGSDRDQAAAYVRAQNEEWDRIQDEQKTGTPVKIAGDFASLIDDFQRDPAWYLAKAPRTREEIDYVFGILRARLGPHMVRAFGEEHALAYYNEMRVKSGYSVHKARKIMKWMIRLLWYAKKTGRRSEPPIWKLELEVPKSRDKVWTPDEVAAVIAAAETGGKATSGNAIPPRPSVALATRIAYDTSLPQQDVLALTWTQFDGQGLTVRQIKPRGEHVDLWLPLSRQTLAVLDSQDRTSTHIIVSEETGQPYADRRVFSRMFRRFRDRAGVDKTKTFQDLRRTALTELGNHGATNAEIVKFSGHDINSRVLKTYIRPDRTAAENAARKRWKLDQ